MSTVDLLAWLYPLLRGKRADPARLGTILAESAQATAAGSATVRQAFANARALGLGTVGLAGGDRGRMAKTHRVGLRLPVATPSIHCPQDCRIAIHRILRDPVHTPLADDRGAPARREGA